MHYRTPFFSAFGPLLFGRAPRKTAADLGRLDTLSELQAAVGKYLPAKLPALQVGEVKSRQRLYSPSITFWAFLSQVMTPQTACREVVRKVQAWWSIRNVEGQMSTGTGAYCRARQRLPLKVLESVHTHLVQRLEQRVKSEQLWHGRAVKIVDGTMLSMPDTTANQAAYPQSSSQKPGLGFPLLRLVGVFSLASGALLHVARGTLHQHESLLFRSLWEHFRSGDILLGDRGFCSYFALSCLLERGVDSVVRLHQARSKVDFREGKYLGPGDRLVTWQRLLPSAQKSLTKQQYAAMPAQITLRAIKHTIALRGFRTREVVLVTTLLDPLKYPAEDLRALYFRRWSVELCFRDIKITLGLDILRCKTPSMIEKEVSVHLIAYNLVRCIMQEAACLHDVALEKISFKGTLDTLRQWANALHPHARRPRRQARLRDQMFALIALDTIPLRPNRSEPRAKKRRPKNYHLLTKPRHQMGNLGHRNRQAKSIPKCP